MVKNIKYVALDGTEFYDEDMCVDYEINLFIPDENELVLLNESLEILPISVKSVIDCEYISIRSDKALKYVELIGEEYGCAVPDKCGNFFCDDTSPNWWSDVQKIFNDAIKLANAFGIEITEKSY